MKFFDSARICKKIENYLDEHYDVENYEIFGEREENSKILDILEFSFKRFFGYFKNYFGFYLNKLIKKKKLTESQIIEKTGLPENSFEIIRNKQNLNIQREVVFALCLTLQTDFKEINKLLDLAYCRNLHKNDKRDIIVAFFIENKIDDVNLLDETLKYFNLRNLRGKKIFSDEVENLIEPIKNYIEKKFFSPIKFSYSGSYHKNKIDKVLEEHKKNFSDYIRELIREKNLSEVEVWIITSSSRFAIKIFEMSF